MKKFLSVLALCTMVFFACSDDKVPEPEPEKPVVPDPIEKPENPTPPVDNKLANLSVVGRYLKNEAGEIVNLHGFTQTYSPFFNNSAWNNYDVQACVSYNKRMVDEVLAAGWKFNFVRMHLDPYWSDDPSKTSVRYEGHERFSESRFRKYLDEVFIPMTEYFISKGMYVVMRPPGVAPAHDPYQGIEVGDTYQAFLLKVWDIISQHAKLKNNSGVMFELANEPVNIKGTDGVWGSSSDACFISAKNYFQTIVDKIRGNNSNNIIWVPGLAYQSSYAGYATHRIEGSNIGFAVHCYPGWFGSDAEQDSAEGIGTSTGGGYESFQRGWDAQVGPVAAFAPIMVTEIDWAPKKYDATWGKSITGTAGGAGFGANFKYIADNSGNVSWLFFTTRSHELAAFKNVPGTPGSYTFLNDPEACPWPMYHWFKEYAEGTSGQNKPVERLSFDGISGTLTMLTGSNKYLLLRAHYTDGTSDLVTAKGTYSSSASNIIKVENGRMAALKDGEATITATFSGVELKVTVSATTFPLTNAAFNPNIWEKGTFDETTKTLVTGQYGFGGWHYNNGINLSGYKYLVVELAADQQCSASFRLFDQNNYWSSPAAYDFGNSRRIVITLNEMYRSDNSQVKVSPANIYYAGFWSTGGKPIVIEKITLEN